MPIVPRAYPLNRSEDGRDPRFTLGLIGDVARVLAERGYPAVATGEDFVRLQRALFGFIHGEGR